MSKIESNKVSGEVEQNDTRYEFGGEIPEARLEQIAGGRTPKFILKGQHIKDNG